MAKLIAMATLIARCKRRANRVNDDSIGRTEWCEHISEHYGEAHTVVVEKGARYFDVEATITATGAANYALPTGHLTTREIALVIDGSARRRPVRRIRNTRERTYLAGAIGPARRYDLEAGNIVLYPNPSSGTYKHLYAAQPADYSAANDADEIDLICEAAERFVIWGVASVAQHKGEENQLRAMRERDRAKEELEYWAGLRALEDTARPFMDDEEDDDLDPAEYFYP